MASYIAASCQQTRFDISDSTVFSGLDIKGLNITVVPSTLDNLPAPATEPSKAKSARKKAAADGIEILSNTDLKLNPGIRYALVGKNGSGKSTLLRSIAEKLIPSIAPSTRISILQQISAGVEASPLKIDNNNKSNNDTSKTDSKDRTNQSPLQRVLSSDQIRNDIIHDYELLSAAINGTTDVDAAAPVRAIRQIRLQRLKKELAEVEKNASLRSGARGLQARKELRECEKRFQDAEEAVHTLTPGPDGKFDSDAGTIESESRAALDLYADLQLHVETYTNSSAIAEAERHAVSILRGLGFATDAMMREKPFRELSGGWRMRCLLAESLFQPSDIMILDEPTNFLDLLGIVWLQRFLIAESGSVNGGQVGAAVRVSGGEDGEVMRKRRVVVLVSHDRDFVDSVCDETIVLRDKTLVAFKGNPSAYEVDLRSRILYMGRMKETNDRQVKAMEKSISENMRDAKAKGNDNKIRAAKTRQKRMEERMGMQVSVSGTRFKLNKDRAGFHNTLRDEIEVPTEETGRGFMLPQAAGLRFPGSLVSLEGVKFRYKVSLPLVLDGVELVVHMGDRIGIVGLNGCGKTTLVKLITDATKKPTLGTTARHAQLKLGYYSQHAVEDLQAIEDPTSTALSLMTKEVEGALSEGEIRSLLGGLGLPGRTASDVPISKLSGGQLVRLALARIIWSCPNLLVLDEITTHLDHYAVSALIDALRDYEGALLLVSHDRFLIRCVVQGQRDENDDEDEEDEEDDSRRRVVYVMRGGKLKALEGGVDAFEKSLEKKLQMLAL